MLRVLSLLVLFLAVGICWGEDKPPVEKKENTEPEKKEEPEKKFEQALHDELLAMTEAAQELRKKATSMTRIDPAIVRKINDLDKKHTTRFKQLVSKHGWPTPIMVGDDGVRSAFLLVQYSATDREFQRKCLKLMEEAAAKGELSREYVASMTDFLLVSDKKKQRYGTQYKLEANGQYALYPIEDEENVDKRRAEMGMSTLAEQMKRIQQLRPKKP